MTKIIVDGAHLSIEMVYDVARKNTAIQIDDNAIHKVQNSRKLLENFVDKEFPVYGVTTGYGEMVYILINKKHETELQHNLIRSHAAGVGPYFSKEESRAILLARINSLVKGYSAVREEFIDRLVFYLNNDIIPVIPQIGSLGASGDLAPLSHLAITLIGEGFVFGKDGSPEKTKKILNQFGITPLDLKFKEGLATINGTSAMTGIGSLLVYDAFIQVQTAEIISAIALESQRASSSPFAAVGHDLAKPHQGQVDSACNIRTLLQGSHLIADHKSLCNDLLTQKIESVTPTTVYLQKAYTLRCIPQILGAIRDTLYHVKKVLITELNSANDNPLFFNNEEIFHGGNFHGQPVAFAMDFLSIAITQVGVLSERRTNRLLNKHLNNGLSDFLIKNNPGLCCGLAGAQYPATALVAENRLASTPASIQSIPSNADNQDVVSMGLLSARNTQKIINNTWYILAVELISIVQAIDIAENKSLLSNQGKVVYELVRSFVPLLDQDRCMSEDINKVATLLQTGKLVEALRNSGIDLI
ncbi:MAG TPA: tyrosine 2,3-aminomutase [Amoebophilaceae bacterium]|jgi:histidine ammonia-lyase|nr:tyrosine 2,3-aminomutase [Amoebophilaceae bacterium]